MRYKWAGLMVLACLLLAGCGDNKEENKEAADSNPTEKPAGKEEESAAKEAPSGQMPIEEAANVPEKEKEKLLEVTNKRIEAFNNQDVDAYMDTISKQPASFDYEEEKKYLEQTFTSFNVKMEPQNIEVIKYDEDKKEANVFIAMKLKTKEVDGSSKEITSQSREVHVYRQEEGGWKLISTFAME